MVVPRRSLIVSENINSRCQLKVDLIARALKVYNLSLQQKPHMEKRPRLRALSKEQLLSQDLSYSRDGKIFH